MGSSASVDQAVEVRGGCGSGAAGGNGGGDRGGNGGASPSNLVKTRTGVIDPQLASDLYQYRLARGLSQRELALQLNTHQATVSQAERKHALSVRTRAKFLRFLSAQSSDQSSARSSDQSSAQPSAQLRAQSDRNPESSGGAE